MTEHFPSGVYGFSSDPMAALVRNILHPLWARHTHPAYAGYRREFEVNQYLRPEELRRLQMQRLRQQLVQAYRYAPFYRLRMNEAGLTPLDIQTHDDLSLLPVLTKEDIQNHQDLMLSSNVPSGKRLRNQTSGSTGSPLQFYVDKERFDSRMASSARYDRWAGVRPGDRYAHLWGSQLGLVEKPNRRLLWRQKLLDRDLTLHTASAGEASMMEYVGVLRRYRPRHLLAYANSAVLFAEFCRKNDIHDIAFESMIVSAQALLPGERVLLEDTFGGKVFNRYACREVSVIASECEFHSGLHVNADALLVEVEPTPQTPPGMGRVLITDLLNRSMPLIRYDIGDLASLESATGCPCGRSLPLMGNVQGRSSDFLHRSGGRKITEPRAGMEPHLCDALGQHLVRNRLQHAMLQLVPGTGCNANADDELRRKLQSRPEGQPSLALVPRECNAVEGREKHRLTEKSDGKVAISTAI